MATLFKTSGAKFISDFICLIEKKAYNEQLLTEAKQKLDSESSTSVELHWGKKEVDEILNHMK